MHSCFCILVYCAECFWTQNSKGFKRIFKWVSNGFEIKRNKKENKQKKKTSPFCFHSAQRAQQASLPSLGPNGQPARRPLSLPLLASGSRAFGHRQGAPQVSAANLSSSRGQAGLHIGTEPNPVYHGICCRDRLPCSYKSSGTFPACPFPHLWSQRALFAVVIAVWISPRVEEELPPWFLLYAAALSQSSGRRASRWGFEPPCAFHHRSTLLCVAELLAELRRNAKLRLDVLPPSSKLSPIAKVA